MVLMLLAVGCSQKEADPVNIKVMAPYGTPVLSMVKMFAENPEIGENVTVDYEAIQATDVLSASLINNETDIAVVPTNMAASVFSKGGGYKLAGASVWGVLYFVSSEDITDLQELKGKTISTVGRGLTPDALLRYILTNNGLTPDEDVNIEYYNGSSELAAAFISGESNISMIPEPLLTNVQMKKEDAKVVIDVQEEWNNITGLGKYPQASVIVSQKLIDEHPEIVKAFLEEYQSSVNWVNENPKQAGEYYEQLGIGLNATIIEKSIPRCNLNFVSAKDAKESINGYLEALFTFNPKLIGGKEVDEALYYQE